MNDDDDNFEIVIDFVIDFEIDYDDVYDMNLDCEMIVNEKKLHLMKVVEGKHPSFVLDSIMLKSQHSTLLTLLASLRLD